MLFVHSIYISMKVALWGTMKYNDMSFRPPPLSFHPPALSSSNDKTQRLEATAGLDASSSEIFWKSLDVKEQARCGKYKCLFRKKSDEREYDVSGGGNDGGEIAYLVGFNCRRRQYETEMHLAYNLSQYLQDTHEIRHIYIDAPYRVITTPSSEKIFTNKRHGKRYFQKSRQSCNRGGNVHWDYTIVQKVRMIIPMFTIKKDTWGHEFERFVHEQIVVDKSSFISTFSKEIQSAIRVIKSIPLLVHDHQILVNDKGNIYQFDLDRALHAGYSGRLNDGQSYTNWTFQNSFITDYNRTMEVLQVASAWATGKQTKQNTINLRSNSNFIPSALSVLMNHRNNNALSCKAVEIVDELIRTEKMTVEAKSMMADLVTLTLDGLGSIERNNCSIASFL